MDFIFRLFNSPIKGTIWGILALAALATFWGGWFITPEGYATVVTHFGKADRQTMPGLHFKIPFVDGTRDIEVRQRKFSLPLSAATKNQLPLTADVSVNWTIHESAAMEIFVKYGSLEQFEQRIFGPKLNDAGKTAIAKYGPDELIRTREAATATLMQELLRVMNTYPITINAPQIENVSLPGEYMKSVLDKEKAREDALREEFNLEKQKHQAQQAVNTATAEAEAKEKAADAEAYRITKEADAQAYSTEKRATAEAFRVKTEYTGRAEGVALLSKELTPAYMDYLRAQQWNGQLPTTMLAPSTNALFNLPAPK